MLLNKALIRRYTVLPTKFHRLKPHAADPSKILSSKVLRMSLGPQLSELSYLSYLALWLPGCLAPQYIYGSLAPWPPGGLAPGRAETVPRDPAGSARTQILACRFPQNPGSGGRCSSGSQEVAPRSFPRIWVPAEPGENAQDPGPGGRFPLFFKGNEVFLPRS